MLCNKTETKNNIYAEIHVPFCLFHLHFKLFSVKWNALYFQVVIYCIWTCHTHQIIKTSWLFKSHQHIPCKCPTHINIIYTYKRVNIKPKYQAAKIITKHIKSIIRLHVTHSSNVTCSELLIYQHSHPHKSVTTISYIFNWLARSQTRKNATCLQIISN